MERVIDAHIHVCRYINGFGEGGEMQAVGKGYAQYADGTTFQMIPECLGEYGVTPEAVIRQMDAAGVEKAVMLQGQFLGMQNLYTWQAAQKYPERLAPAAMYDPFCRNSEAVRRHLFEEMKFPILKLELSTGSGLMSYHRSFALDGELMEDMLGYAQAHGNVVVLDIGRYGSDCWQPEALARAIRRHPSVQFVVCHLLAPQGRAHEAEWREGMRALALENVAFDLASLPSNQGEAYPYPNAAELIRQAIDMVGSANLMWGSDLPMNLCRASYRELIDYIRQNPQISSQDKDNILYRTAERSYFAQREEA